MGQIAGNFMAASNYRAQASTARSQGRAQQAFFNKRAENLEEEAASDSHLAARNTGRMRQNQSTAMGSARAARGASGFTSEGSGSQAEIATADVFESALADMALSNAISDSNKRYAAEVSRYQGGLAMQQAESAVSQYKGLARNATTAGLVQGIGSVGSGVLGYTLGYQQADTVTGEIKELSGWRGAQAAFKNAYDLSGTGLSWMPGTFNSGSPDSGTHLFDFFSSIFPKQP